MLSVTTADAAAQERTALVHAHALTAAAHRRDDIRHHPSSLTSRPNQATITASQNLVGVTVTAEVEVLGTRGSTLAHGPALLSNWTERGTGRGTETAALMTVLQRNTNTSEEVDIGTGGTGRGLGPTRGSAATRVNTTAAVDTQDTDATGAETLYQTSSGADGHVSVCTD